MNPDQQQPQQGNQNPAGQTPGGQAPQQSPPQSQQPSPPQQPQNGQAIPGERPQVVFMSRPMEPEQIHISDATMRKHQASKKHFPYLNLSEGEFVISVVRRHIIGLLGIWASVFLVLAALVAVAAFAASGQLTADLGTGLDDSEAAMIVMIPLILVSMLTLIFGMIATYIYTANRFFLTNESVIQHIQVGLFNKREQTVSLSNIEDASYAQDGILPHLLDYGLIRLSTEGDETTYRFSYASRPKQQIAVLNNAVEAFKNGRPVTGED